MICLLFIHLFVIHIDFLFSKLLSQLSTPLRRSLDARINDLVEVELLERLEGSVSRSVRARDRRAKLRRRVGRVNEHLARAGAGLGGQASGHILGETERNTAGNEVLDDSEEVGGAGS